MRIMEEIQNKTKITLGRKFHHSGATAQKTLSHVAIHPAVVGAPNIGPPKIAGMVR